MIPYMPDTTPKWGKATRYLFGFSGFFINTNTLINILFKWQKKKSLSLVMVTKPLLM